MRRRTCGRPLYRKSGQLCRVKLFAKECSLAYVVFTLCKEWQTKVDRDERDFRAISPSAPRRWPKRKPTGANRLTVNCLRRGRNVGKRLKKSVPGRHSFTALPTTFRWKLWRTRCCRSVRLRRWFTVSGRRAAAYPLRRHGTQNGSCNENTETNGTHREFKLQGSQRGELNVHIFSRNSSEILTYGWFQHEADLRRFQLVLALVRFQ